MNTIGFVGLGAMGSRIATRLIASDNHSYGTNRTAAKARPLIERGMTWMDTPREVAAAADITFSMVTDDHALQTISHGPDGILAAIAPGKVYVDASTVSPKASRELSACYRLGCDTGFLHVSLRSSLIVVTLGGTIVLAIGVAIGNA